MCDVAVMKRWVVVKVEGGREIKEVVVRDGCNAMVEFVVEVVVV